MKEYTGPRDLNSLKEFVVMMKTKAFLTDDADNERVTEHAAAEDVELTDLLEDEDEEDDEAVDVEKPAQV